MRRDGKREAFLVYSFTASPIHLLDARSKLLALALLATATMASRPAGLVPIFAAFSSGLYLSRISIGRLVAEGRGVAFLIIAILAASALSAEGALEGIVAGALYSVRLVLLLLLAGLWIGTTSIDELRAGVARLMRPFPPRLAWSLSSLVALAVGFVSLPLTISEEVTLACRARGLEPKKHPIRYARLLALSVTIRSLAAAETKSLAFACRGGDPKARIQGKRIGLGSLAAVALSLLASGLALVL